MDYFIDTYVAGLQNIKWTKYKCGNFNSAYEYWKEQLFERSIHRFHWNCGDVPEREIEIPLASIGLCGITNRIEDKMIAFAGWWDGGITQYYDDFTKFSIMSPKQSKTFEVGKDIVVIRGNSTTSPLLPLICKYAEMLAHTEISIISTLINGRDSGGIPIAGRTNQVAAIENYRKSLVEGDIKPILDPAFSGVQFVGVNKNTTLDIKALVEVRENILNSFYNDIGVKTSWNKKGNMIVEEVQANEPMLLLNISDELECRKKACEEINALFGTNWSVELAPELQYDEDSKEDSEDNEEDVKDDRETEDDNN